VDTLNDTDNLKQIKSLLSSRNAMLIFALGVISLVFHGITLAQAAANPFLSARSISTVFMQASVIGVLACGMTLIIILTHIDLSVGAAIAFLGGLAAWMMGADASVMPEALAGTVPTGLGLGGGITCCLLVGAGIVLWGLMGLLQARTGMPAFIITLGGMMGYRGLALLVVKRERPIPVGGFVDRMGTGYLDLRLGWLVLALIVAYGVYKTFRAQRTGHAGWYVSWIPVAILAGTVLFLQLPHEGVLETSRGLACLTCIWAGVAIGLNYLTRCTVYGRHLYAAGGNAEAATLCGIRVQRVNLIAFAVMGALTALASLMYLGQQGTAESGAGQLGELDAIAACVIGGVSLRGGKGSISGAVIGTLIMQSLTTGLYQCNVESGYQFLIKAIVLVAVVALDHVLRKES
jgi:D-xylose transport system permease protein